MFTHSTRTPSIARRVGASLAVFVGVLTCAIPPVAAQSNGSSSAVIFGQMGTENPGMEAEPPVYTLRGPGADFVVSGTATRTMVQQQDPFALNIAALPSGAALKKVLINWTYLTQTECLGGVDTITINGTPIQGTVCGSAVALDGMCWGNYFAGVSFLAELDPGMSPILHGQQNTIGGATDKALAGQACLPSTTLAIGQGISVMCVYEVPNAPERVVDVFCGYTSTESSYNAIPTARLDMRPSLSFGGGNMHVFFNGLDGQMSPTHADRTLASSSNFFGSIAGLTGGTVMDVWQGRIGPTGVNDLYDHAEVTYVIPFQCLAPVFVWSLRDPLDGQAQADCVGNSFGALAYTVGTVAPGAPWTVTGPGKACSNGVTPTMTGSSDVANNMHTVTIANTLPCSTGTLFTGFSAINAPFYGGILGPSPDFVAAIKTNGAGQLVIPFQWPAGVLCGEMIWIQAWFDDPSMTQVACATNTLRGTIY